MNSWWLHGRFGIMSRPCRDALRCLRLSPHCVRCYSYLTPLGWFMYNWKVKSENWKVKIEKWKVATSNLYSNLINPTWGEVLCGWGQILLFCEPEVCYLVDWYEVACLRHAWGWSSLPHTARLRCLVWGYWDCMPPARLVMVPVTPHCTPSVFSVGLLRLRIFDTLIDGHCYPTLHTFCV